jgi:hypothetical protein
VAKADLFTGHQAPSSSSCLTTAIHKDVSPRIEAEFGSKTYRRRISWGSHSLVVEIPNGLESIHAVVWKNIGHPGLADVKIMLMQEDAGKFKYASGPLDFVSQVRSSLQLDDPVELNQVMSAGGIIMGPYSVYFGLDERGRLITGGLSKHNTLLLVL